MTNYAQYVLGEFGVPIAYSVCYDQRYMAVNSSILSFTK